MQKAIAIDFDGCLCSDDLPAAAGVVGRGCFAVQPC